MAVGLAGLPKGKRGYIWGTLLGCFVRFLVHYISGIVLYAEYMPDEFLGLTMTSVPFYSALYNGLYMLPNTIIALIICGILEKPMEKLKV